jgi:hypothetical protein
VLAAIFSLNGRASYLSWHFIQISVPNAAVIVLMLVVFGVALFARFPGGHHGEGEDDGR